jgi:dTDP-4-amino-4,6-dideoxygalactose transaminase
MTEHVRTDAKPIAFIDLAAQRRRLGARIDEAIARVTTHCQFILGPEVRALEAELAQFCGARHAVSCASGTDALVLVLMAKGIGPGDAVFCPAFTFCATAEVAALLGATPVFADVDEATFNIDPASLERAIAKAKRLGLKPKAVIPVDLFGLPAEHDALAALAAAESMFILDDAAQAFGATYRGRPLGTFGHATATSFFPAKPLGCYGDGGAVLTDDDVLMDVMVSLRVHGQATRRDVEAHGFAHDPKYLNMRVGMNSRLDTMQAAILIEKLKVFADEIAWRNAAADRYTAALAGSRVRTPIVIPGGRSTWAQYTIEHPDRDGLMAYLKALDIPTAAYYPMPMHTQECYARYPAPGGLPVSEAKADVVLSLPMHADLDADTQDLIVDAVLGYNG